MRMPTGFHLPISETSKSTKTAILSKHRTEQKMAQLTFAGLSKPTGGTIGFDIPAFTLPEGFRPIQAMYFIGVASSIGTGSIPQIHRTLIDTDGRVCIQSSSNTVNPSEFITFGFKFRAA